MANRTIYGRRLPVHCLLLTLACCSVSLAQKPARKAEFWRAQAQAITDDLMKDAAAFAPIERSILFVQLGDAWWQDDQERGHAWLQKAVDEVTSFPDQESPTDRKRRIAAARNLLPIVARRDEELNNRLVNALLSLSSEKDSQGENVGNANAEALVNTAVSIVRENSHRAAALGSQSVRIGRTNKLITLLLELREIDANSANALFNDALNTAQPTHDPELLSFLVAAAYPKLQVPMYQRATFSADIRAKLLSVLIEGFLPPQKQGDDAVPACGLAQITAPVLSEVFQMFPQQAIIVRMELSKCAATSQRIEDALGSQPLKTVDDFLAAAGREPNPIKAGLFLVRAAVLASQHNNFDRAINILESLNSEQRKMLGDGWENVRISFAIGAAINFSGLKNYAGVQQVVDAVPAELRPFVQIPVADNLLSNKGDSEFAFALLEEARQKLAKITQSDAENSKDRLIYSYLTLVRLYALIDPVNALYTLREAVATINKAVNTKTAEDETTSENLFGSFTLPGSLLEADPIGTREAISSVVSPTRRALARLSFLRLSLEKKRTTKPRPIKKTQAKAGAQTFLDAIPVSNPKMIKTNVSGGEPYAVSTLLCTAA